MPHYTKRNSAQNCQVTTRKSYYESGVKSFVWCLAATIYEPENRSIRRLAMDEKKKSISLHTAYGVNNGPFTSKCWHPVRADNCSVSLLIEIFIGRNMDAVTMASTQNACGAKNRIRQQKNISAERRGFLGSHNMGNSESEFSQCVTWHITMTQRMSSGRHYYCCCCSFASSFFAF